MDFGAAIDYLQHLGYEKIQELEAELLDYARIKLEKLDYLELYITPNKNNHSSVISFNIKGVHPHDVASILDSKGVCVRSRKSLCTTSYEVFRNRFDLPSKFLYIQYKRRCRQASRGTRRSV